MSKQESEQPVSMTMEQISALVNSAVSAAITESRKPMPPTEKEQKAIEQALQDRRETAALVSKQLDMRRARQHACAHYRGGLYSGTHCVYVANGNFLICQRCQAIIRPGNPPDDYRKDRYIYDSKLFMEHLQQAQAGGTDY
jgi:hypothetical protein